MDLKQIFIQLINGYTNDESVINSFWNEIEKKYSGRRRHYHTLAHLQSLIGQLNEYRQVINDWDTLLCSVFYHDIVYNVLKNDNEEKSADLAVKRLSILSVPTDKVTSCHKQILATKSHLFSDNDDTNLFIDADLSILGQSPGVYQHYCLQIRKEYSIYPDIVYKPGRKKVIIHFLRMQRIFKTAQFYDKYELQARENLQSELNTLQKNTF